MRKRKTEKPRYVSRVNWLSNYLVTVTFLTTDRVLRISLGNYHLHLCRVLLLGERVYGYFELIHVPCRSRITISHLDVALLRSDTSIFCAFTPLERLIVEWAKGFILKSSIRFNPGNEVSFPDSRQTNSD